MALWGGRFEGAADPLFRAFNDSLPVDARLVEEDVRGSIAWARALARAGVLAGDELERIVGALSAIGEAGGAHPERVAAAADEDVHSWVERELVERTGPLGKKLHTGRSRNDQVATDLRLFTRSAIDARRAELLGAQRSLVALARRYPGAPFPGYTHLQRAQPVLFAHWCLAYVEMLERDRERFADARRRVNVCPLGSGALAGTAFPIDRFALAADLGFEGVTRNSLDAVSDRSFVLEVLACAAVCGAGLSRLAEDLVVYSSGEFGLVEMADAVTSGSSLMPQKKNPDAMELVRGKTGRIAGALVGALMTVKGLPLAYNKDLQEDKPPLFDALDQLGLCLRMTARVLDGVTLREATARSHALAGYANATELADHLVARGVPFRDAHEQAGRAVRAALQRGVPLESLTLAELRAAAPGVGESVHSDLTLDACLRRREVPGGTGPGAVREALDDAAARLGMD